ncbi:MAG: hypothetical protein Q7T11_00965, partial [Deltaproteobacteria bacterium]|nr:hypothetical protein [Deltaproteobacteria bacterium]
EGHARLESKSGPQKNSDGGGGDGGGGQGGGQQGGSFGGGGGGGGSMGGGSFGEHGSQTGSRGQKQASQKAGHQKVESATFSSFREARSGNRPFTEKNLDEVVEAVRLGVTSSGEKEIEITLSGDYFSGLKIRGTKTAEGIVLVFVCPHAEVKKIFLIERPRIYSRFKEKNIRVCRIDVV